MGLAHFGQMSGSTSYIFCIKRAQDLRRAGEVMLSSMMYGTFLS